MREKNNEFIYNLGFRAGFDYANALATGKTPTPKTTPKRRKRGYKWSYHKRKKLSARMKQAHENKKLLGLPWKNNQLKQTNE